MSTTETAHRVTLNEAKGRLAARPMPHKRDGGYDFGTPQLDGSIKLNRKARRYMETLEVLASSEDITPRALEFVNDRRRRVYRALARYAAQSNERAAKELAARVLSERLQDGEPKHETQVPHVHKQHADVYPSSFCMTAAQRKQARAHRSAKIKNSEKF